MRRFKKNSAVRIVVVPPHGRVHEGDILEGDEYAAYAPMYLTEILPTSPVVAAPVVKVLTEETPPLVDAATLIATPPVTHAELVVDDAAAVDSAESPEEATLSVESTPPKKKGGRPRKQA